MAWSGSSLHTAIAAAVAGKSGDVSLEVSTAIVSTLADEGAVINEVRTDKIVGKTGNAVTVGDANYDRLEIADDGTPKGCLQKVDDDDVRLFWNAYYDGAFHSYDSTRHSWMYMLNGPTGASDCRWYVAQPTAGTPSFTELMRLTEGGYLKVGGAEACKTYTFPHTISTGEASAKIANVSISGSSISMSKIRGYKVGIYDVSADDFISRDEADSTSLTASGYVVGNDAGVGNYVLCYWGTNYVAGDVISVIIWVAE